MAVRKQSRRFLECVEDKLLGAGVQLTCYPNKKELLEDANVKGSLGCRDHKVVELMILSKMSKINRITVPDFRKTALGLFRDLLGKIP